VHTPSDLTFFSVFALWRRKVYRTLHNVTTLIFSTQRSKIADPHSFNADNFLFLTTSMIAVPLDPHPAKKFRIRVNKVGGKQHKLASVTQPKLLILGQVIQRYYVQYLAGYDAVALAQMIQTTSVTSEEDNVILSSICTQISQLSLDNVEVIHSLIALSYLPEH